jgi:drug/metabolite transporter (DMT)-like permease
MDNTTDGRIARVFARDRRAMWVLLAVLWLCLAGVWWVARQHVADSTVGVVLAIAALVLGALNTASAVAMVRHYRDDRDHIYGLDLHHLDARRAARARGRA